MWPLYTYERQRFWNECVCRHVEYWTIPLGRTRRQAGLSCQLKELNWLKSYFYTRLRPWKSKIECYFSSIWWDKNVWLRYFSAEAYRTSKCVYYGNITGSRWIPGSACPVLSAIADIGLEIRKRFTSWKTWCFMLYSLHSQTVSVYLVVIEKLKKKYIFYYHTFKICWMHLSSQGV